jgi:Domain of unknown function (DUF4145)
MVDAEHSTARHNTKGQAVRTYCKKCNGLTNHVVMASEDIHEEYEHQPGSLISSVDNYQVIKCGGCDAFSFRHRNWNSESQDVDTDDDGVTEKIYPEHDAEWIAVKSFQSVPRQLRELYREIVISFNRDCHTLCAAGLRTLVEGICADKKVAKGKVSYKKNGETLPVYSKDLDGKIAGLHEQGVLSKAHAETLNTFRFLGNDAAHKRIAPPLNELEQAIEILEHLLEHIYEVPQKSLQLEESRQARKKPKSS